MEKVLNLKSNGEGRLWWGISLWGLFLPYRYKGKWCFTMTIDSIPLGWIILLIVIIVELMIG